MALFQRRPQAGEVHALYSVGLHKNLMIVGLGNPGTKYTGTRHNIGFECVEAFAKAAEFPDWTIKKDLKCELTQATLNGTRVTLVKPTTFMNLSGEAVQAVMGFYKLSPENVAVVHDELDINFGQIRTRVGGSAAGHNGIKSVIEHIGENFGRVRIGIGPKIPEQIDSADFVLQKFNKEAQEKIPALTREVSAVLNEYVYGPGTLTTETRNFLL